MLRRTLLAAGAAVPFFDVPAEAANYPSRPLRMVLPFPPGGSTDVIARLISQKLSDQLGQPVVAVNAPGAGGMIAAQQVISAPADGYTLFYPNASTLTIAPQLMRQQGPEPWTQFSAITPTVGFSLVLVAHPSVAANDLQELIGLARAKPDTLNFASPGVGTTPHLMGELLKRETGVRMTHVAYKGAGPAVSDLLAGTVQLFFEQPLTVVPHLKAGKLKAIAVTSRERHPMLPDVPTVTEAGLPQLRLQSWSGFVVRRDTPAPVVARLHGQISKVLDLPEVREAVTSRGLEPMQASSEEFDLMIREEYPRWTSIIRSQDIVAE